MCNAKVIRNLKSNTLKLGSTVTPIGSMADTAFWLKESLKYKFCLAKSLLKSPRLCSKYFDSSYSELSSRCNCAYSQLIDQLRLPESERLLKIVRNAKVAQNGKASIPLPTKN